MALKITTASGKEISTDAITVTFLDRKQRLKRTFKAVGPVFGVGVVFIFIPVLHFFVPPCCFLASVITFVQRISEHVLLTAESFSCLQCGTHFKINQGGQSIGDSFFNCPSCSQRHYLAPI